MADSNIIREFLVGLGFKVDASSEAKFKDGVERASTRVRKLDKDAQQTGKSILGMGAAIVTTSTMVGRSALGLASRLEAMHFAAKRTGAAASSLRAISNAAADVGVSAEEAMSSVEGVANFMRNNPSGESYIASLGVQTRDVNGKLRDTVDIVNDLGKSLSKQPHWLARQFGANLGINENHLRGMREQQYFTEFERSRKNFQDSGIDKTSGQAHGLMKQWRDLQEGIEGKVGPVGTWAAKTGAAIGGGFLSYLGLKSAAQQMIGRALGTGVGTAASQAAAKTAATTAASTAAGSSAGWLARTMPWLARVGGGLGLLFRSGNLNTGEEAELARRRAMGGPVPGATGAARPGGLAQSSFGSLVARGEGDYNSVNRGKAGGYKAGKENLEGMTVAEVMQAQRDGKFNAAGRYQIIKSTLADAFKTLGLSGNEKFDRGMQDRIFEQYLVNHKRKPLSDYLSGKSNNIHAAMLAASQEWASVADPRTGKSFYAGVGNNKASISAAELERALINSRATNSNMLAATQYGGQGRKGAQGGEVNVNQDIKINVTGAGDPKSTARAIAEEQRNINDGIVREFQWGVS